MQRRSPIWSLFLLSLASGCGTESSPVGEYDPPGRGPYAVGSTNLAVAAEYAAIGDERMHAYLLGIADDAGNPRYVADVLEHPESAWVIDVDVPEDDAVYGPASGRTLPVVAIVTFPSAASGQARRYAFPYHDSTYGVFEDMLGPGEAPAFADADTRYPLIVLAHGSSAHGIYDVGHAHRLASHGYIVAVVFYGDDRTAVADSPNVHAGFLRPLLTRAIVDSLLASDSFGPRIDSDNIGISGHSFGGFTALAAAGAAYRGDPATASDARIGAAVLAAPWVGADYDGTDVFAFGAGNQGLANVDVPVLCAFGSSDGVTESSFILPAMRQLAGPTYVVELVDQPHVFEGGSWQDRDNWELLFFDAYLKNDTAALAALETTVSMQGGNEDRQLFEYQRITGRERPGEPID